MVRFQMFIESREPQMLDLPRGCYTLGAADDNHVVVGLSGMAPHHLEIRVTDGGQTRVRDLTSRHGVTLNGRVIEEAGVVPGDVLKLGKVVLTAELMGESEVATSAAAEGHSVGWSGFFASLAGAFGYPLTEGGLFIIGGVAMFSGLSVLGGILTMPMAMIVGVAIGIYLLLVFRGIIESSIQGRESMPTDPAMIFDWEELKEIFLPMFAVVLFPSLPYIFAGYWPDRPEWLQPCLGVIALFYVPMALLLLLVTDEILAAHPGNVLLSVVRAPWGYLVVLLFLLPVLGLEWLSDPAHALGAGRSRLLLAGQEALLELGRTYTLFVWARVLGLYYRAYRDDLGWEDRE